jgi:hypothetical protein
MAQDNLNAYAQWLVQNKDKKGTPEFDKVARAFQMLQAAGPRQAEAPVNPPGTGVGRAFQRGVIGTKQGIQAGIATNAANTLESMDVDRLTTIRRALSLVVPKDALAMMERDGTLQALGGVRNEDELNRWFDSLDRDFDLGPQNVAKLKAMVGGAEAAKSDYRAPGGKFETVRQTGQDALTRASELEADRAALPMSPTAQRGAQDFQDAEGVMEWARKSFKDPMAALAFIGETAAETGPAMAAGIGTSVVTGNPLLGAGIMIAASTPREYGGEVMSFLRDQDINVSDPQAIREAIDNGNIMAEAQKRGLTKAAIISAFEAIGMKGGGNILLQGGKQAFTGGAGEAASQVALDGEITSAKEVALEAVAELATTPGEAAILYTKNGTLKDPSSLSDTESQAAASLANRIRTIASQNGYNLKDVGSTGDAKQALEAAHEQISGQIKEIVANPAVKKYLNPKQAKTLDQLIDDYAAAQVAIRQGKNKVKSKVTQENFNAIMRLLPPTVEAQQIANLMREGNQLTDLFKNGTKGGISQFTDTFNPFTREDGSYDPSKVISGMANKGVAIATMGGSLPYQFSAVGAGRAIDAVTGRRSAVNRFVNKFENKETLPDPVGPSLIAAERLKKEQDDARAAELGGLPQVDKDNSPVGTILSGTGLDRDGLKAAMTEIEAAFPDVKALEDVFGDIRKNLDGGTNRIRNLNDIIPVINQHLNTPDTVVKRAAAPDQLLAQRGGVNIPNIDQTPAQDTPTPDVMSQAPQFGPQLTTQENYNRGIEANKAMNAELVEGVTTDPELNRVQKGRLITSLDVLANNLGSDPVAAAQEQVQKLEEAGVPQEAIDAYVKPYVDRVTRQQAARVSPDEPMLPDVDPTSDPSVPQTPALQSYVNPLQVPDNEIDATRLTTSPSEAEIQKMREGTYKPKTKRTLVEAADYMHQKWKAATGRDEPFEYTPENVDIISTYMATEAVNALQSDANAIGWYDRKLKAAKRVVSLVDPRVTQSPDAEVAFDFALAITSNGQAVADNFQYALEVFRYFMDNGQMPTTTWKKGGERNIAMVEAFDFFNAYQASGTNMPIQDFMDQDFTVNELKDWAASFNDRYGTNIKVPSSEGASEMVKGSFIAGPKIGQGFYQNIRGNYDPLTMDIWWMRMWNRLVGRPFEANKDLDTNRARVRKALQTKNQDALEKRLTKETLKDMGLTRADLKNNDTLDEFVLNLESRYQSFYRQESKRLKGTNQKVPKPELANATGTMKRNLSPQLQATPKGPGERSYMRDVTKAAIAKLRDLGYNIETADFQALMWYPEKQLFRHLGVAPGRGADNDYLDAAIMLAEAEGITNDQIQEALPDADGDGAVNNQSDPSGAYENGNRGASGNGPSTEGPTEPILRDTSPGANPDGPRPDVIPAEKPQVTPEQYKKAVVELIRPQFQIGLKGGELEDGISNFNDAVEFARKLGVVVRLAMSQNELNTLLKLDTGQDPSKFGDARGMFQRKGPKKQGKGTEGTIWAMKPGADKGDGTYVTDIEALTTLLHEISHAITLGPLDGKSDQEVYSYFINRKQSSKPGTGIVGRSDFTPPGSFVDSAIKPLMDADWEQMSPTQKKAYAEIVDLQENVEAYSPKNPGERRAVRFIRKVMASGLTPQTKQAYQDYTRMAAEFAVDPVWVYLINPKLAKKLMPTTSKMIQQEFRKADNKVIQFYAHPLAVVMAALVALEMAMDDDEERRQQQMPPGALNAPMAPGMLSQA